MNSLKGAPLTKDETALLVNLVCDNKAVLSKATNATNNKLKDVAWGNITDAFNASITSYPRKVEQLRLKWENLKKAARKRSAKIRMNNLKTGGGKPDFIPPDDTLEKVASILGTTCEGYTVEVGGDAEPSSVIVMANIVLEEDKSFPPIQNIEDSDGAGPSGSSEKEVTHVTTITESPQQMPTKFLFHTPSGNTYFEEDQLKGGDDSIQYSDSEDIISLAVVKEEQSDVTAKFEEDQLKGDDDSIQYSDSEDIISLAVVKNEQSDVTATVPKKPRLDAQKNCEDKPSKNLKRSDQSKDKIEEPKSETKEAVEDKPVKNNKRVETCDKLDMKLHNNKQNNSTSDHNDVHKEISANNIRAHQSVNSNSSNELKRFVCDTCQKCFRYKSYFVRHIHTHTGERPYQCNECKKGFCKKNDLMRHTRTHTGEKPYQCNECKKGFSAKRSLDIHTRTHTGEQPYQCNECKKCFTRKTHLDIHSRTHTGERPYQCNECKKCFSLKYNLHIHTRTHTGERPYQCNECKKGFCKKNDLMRHTRTHTGEKPYQCNECKKGFSVKSSLRKHICLLL